MTLEELLAIVATAKSSSSSAWAAAVVVEQANGPLKRLTDNKGTSNTLFEIAQDCINRPIPLYSVKATVVLEGARFLEVQRSGSVYAGDALDALATYVAAPYYGRSRGSSWAQAVNISTP